VAAAPRLSVPAAAAAPTHRSAGAAASRPRAGSGGGGADPPPAADRTGDVDADRPVGDHRGGGGGGGGGGVPPCRRGGGVLRPGRGRARRGGRRRGPFALAAGGWRRWWHPLHRTWGGRRPWVMGGGWSGGGAAPAEEKKDGAKVGASFGGGGHRVECGGPGTGGERDVAAVLGGSVVACGRASPCTALFRGKRGAVDKEVGRLPGSHGCPNPIQETLQGQFRHNCRVRKSEGVRTQRRMVFLIVVSAYRLDLDCNLCKRFRLFWCSAVVSLVLALYNWLQQEHAVAESCVTGVKWADDRPVPTTGAATGRLR